MSIKVRIPTQLRALVGGAGEVEVEGATVGDALKALDASYPGFGERLFDEGGNLRRFVNVFMGEEDIRFLEGLGTPRVRLCRSCPPSRAASNPLFSLFEGSLRASAPLRCTVSTRRV